MGLAFVTLLLQACVFVPRTRSVYNEACRVYTQQMSLTVEEVGSLGGCSNNGCLGLLVAAGVISAASAVVSGSIVIAGNVAYWLEERGRCNPDDPLPEVRPLVR